VVKVKNGIERKDSIVYKRAFTLLLSVPTANKKRRMVSLVENVLNNGNEW
jgi:hypothetical protein